MRQTTLLVKQLLKTAKNKEVNSDYDKTIINIDCDKVGRLPNAL